MTNSCANPKRSALTIRASARVRVVLHPPLESVNLEMYPKKSPDFVIIRKTPVDWKILSVGVGFDTRGAVDKSEGAVGGGAAAGVGMLNLDCPTGGNLPHTM